MSRDLSLSFDTAPVQLPAAADFRLGRLDVRPSACEAIRDGERQHVEPRVMQVLVALVRAGGAVVSRQQLIDTCWDARVVGEGSINRCISKLRELADAGEGREDFRIETIARIGYRLNAAEGVVEPAPVAAPAPAPVEPRPFAIAPAPVVRRGFALAAVVSLVIGIVALLGWLGHGDDSVAATAKPLPSIAVMPFETLSTDADAAFFARGMRDEVLTRLGRIGALRVISRLSADRMAERTEKRDDIARRLGVADLVEGTVQRSGNTVRVNVQLIGVAGDAHRWAESYDRSLDDTLTAENEIADAIAAAIASRIAPDVADAADAPALPDRHAYELYLHAVVEFRNDAQATYKAAADLLRESVAADPSFAPAWALLSRADASLYFGGEGGEAGRVESRQALDKALALAPALPEVQLADGLYKYRVERDFEGAAKIIGALKAKWPNNVEVVQSYAFVARRLLRWQESIDALRDVVRLDPLVPVNYDLLADTLAMHRELPEAVKVLDAGLALWPDDAKLLTHKIGDLQRMGELDRSGAELARLPATHIDEDALTVRSVQYARKREFAEGLRYFEGVRAMPEAAAWAPEDTALLETILGDFRRRTGDEKGARAAYEAAIEVLRVPSRSNPDDPELGVLLAAAYSGLGDEANAMLYADRAAAWYPNTEDPLGAYTYDLERALTLARLGNGDAAIPALEHLLDAPGCLTVHALRLDPVFDPLRNDRRFAALLEHDARAE